MKPIHLATAAALLIIGLVLWLLAALGEFCRAGAVTIHAVPETTRELIVVERYWFKPDRSYRVQIRHIDGHPAWATQDKHGKWTSAFSFQEPAYTDE